MGNDIRENEFIKSFIPKHISNETAINSIDKLKIKNIKFDNYQKMKKTLKIIRK